MICCNGFKEIAMLLDWFRLENSEILVMPTINGVRVNYCPCCGASVRNIKVSFEEIER